MKTIQRKYRIIEDEALFLEAMEFDREDIGEVLWYKDRDPHHTLLLYIADGGRTILVTPSEADIYFYILHDEDNEDIIDYMLDEIQRFIDDGYLIEL